MLYMSLEKRPPKVVVTMESREASKIPFLEFSPLDRLMGAKLPIKEMIFRNWWFYHKVEKNTMNDAMRAAAKAVITFWSNAGLKAKKIDCILKDVGKWVKMYQVYTI